MFERIEARAERAAEARAVERKAALAEQLREILPRDIHVEPTGDGVLLSARGLVRHVVIESSLRWTIAGLLK